MKICESLAENAMGVHQISKEEELRCLRSGLGFSLVESTFIS